MSRATHRLTTLAFVAVPLLLAPLSAAAQQVPPQDPIRIEEVPAGVETVEEYIAWLEPILGPNPSNPVWVALDPDGYSDETVYAMHPAPPVTIYAGDRIFLRIQPLNPMDWIPWLIALLASVVAVIATMIALGLRRKVKSMTASR